MATKRRRRTTSPARRARYQRRRAKRVARADNDLTDAQWEALRSAWGGCAYCGEAAPDGTGLQRDCIQPIARGGRYTLANVVPSCRSCNASKGSDEVTSWMRRKKLDESTFLVRQRAVLAQMATSDAGDDDRTG